ncbi:MAG: SIS domain-containing protein [Deltaproteobacteria bacterium]|nr:SIS domain-containing protein [Deltaproteobacteria bacterium]
MTTPLASQHVKDLIALLQDVRCSGRDQQAIPFDDAMQRVVDRLLLARSQGKKAILVGNGGSASVVGHLQMDLCNAVRLRALCFHDAPLLTALSNDFGYPTAFERCVQLWAEPGDLLFGISSSGRSENILRAVDAARARDCGVITLSGFAADNPLRQRGDLNIHVGSKEYGPVETAHACLAHMLTDMALATTASASA